MGSLAIRLLLFIMVGTILVSQDVAAQASMPPGFVYVQGGTYTMGDLEPNEDFRTRETSRRVTVSSFAISTTHVTVREFRTFVEATGYKTTAEIEKYCWVRINEQWVEKTDASWKNPYHVQTDDCPVVFTSWYDAMAYCNWKSQVDGRTPVYSCEGETDLRKWPAGWNLDNNEDITADFSANGYRLPTDAEWEYAAKGGPAISRLSVKDIYAGSSDIDSVAWYAGNSGGRSRPVATKKPNALGLFDMSGNALQWCHDWNNSGNKAQDLVDPVGDEGPPFKILRGGSWSMAAYDCRSGMHHGDDAYNYSDDKGFRLVCRVGL
jgi:formylglycine-generating enzyme required for sulfatase activity